MNHYEPILRSPIRGAPLPANAQFQLSDWSGVPVTLIQGDVADLLETQFGQVPDRPGMMVTIADGFLARLTPRQFYLFGTVHPDPDWDVPAMAATLETSFRRAGRFAHATDYSGGTAVLRAVGRALPESLSKLCGLDLRPDHFPNLHVAQTSMAKVKTLIARHDEGNIPGYFLHVDAPLGQYFWETVLDAGREFLRQ